MHEIRVNVQSAKERTRAALLDSTERSLARIGYAQLTMEQIAEERASRAAPPICTSAARKRRCWAPSTASSIAVARLTSLADSQAPAADRLLRMLVARVIIRAESVQGYYQALDGLFASLRAPLLDRRRAYFAREAELLAAVLREGQRAGEFGAANVQKTADLLILCTNALLPHGLSEADFVDRGLERRARSVAQLLLEGVRRRPTRKKGN